MMKLFRRTKPAPEIDTARYVLHDPYEKWPDFRPPDQSSLSTRLWHLDGVPWFEYEPLPPRRHECWPQTRGLYDFRLVYRCACGAIALDDTSYWMERNQTRNNRERQSA